jgi:predicted MFS family arabinose efflux permease
MAIHGIGGSLGLALGPVLGAGCTVLVSWRFAYITISIVNILLFMITLISSKYFCDTPYIDPQENKIKSKTNKPALKYYYAVSVLMGFAFSGFTTFMPTHLAFETRSILHGISDTMRGGIFTTIVLLSGIVGQSMGGWAGARLSLTKYLFWVILFNIPFFVLLGLVSNYWLIGTALLLGIVHFNWQPVANLLIARLTHSSHRGLGYGINFFLNIGFGAGAAAIGGFIAEKFGVTYIFPLMGIVLFPALILSWILIGKVEEI